MATLIPTTDSIHLSGLFPEGCRVLSMLSGGSDSVCLTHLLVEALGPDRVVALHVNHGLRAEADADERACAELCAALGVELRSKTAVLEAGNTEAAARNARYALAEELRAELDLDLIATGHTADDQVETVLYRLISSPGRRSLLGIARTNGRLVRPLLDVGAGQVVAYCEQHGLSWVEDLTNADLDLARNRLRHEVIPALRELHDAADQNLLATAAELAEESRLLDAIVDQAIGEVGAGGSPPSVEMARLAPLEPAIRRLILRRLAEMASGGQLALDARRARELEALAARGGSAHLDLPGGVRATSEYGILRFSTRASSRAPETVTLPVPGSCRFGDWLLECSREPLGHSALAALNGPDEALVDLGQAEGPLLVRAWEPGDRIKPVGFSGSKSLQDLFTDRKVPRSLRAQLPVVVRGDEVVWVAGVACSDRFKVTPEAEAVFRLSAGTR